MNKLFITAVMAISLMAMPVAAQQTTMTKAEIKAAMKAEKAQRKKRDKETSASSTPVVVAPTPAPTPVVTPAPVVVPTPNTLAITPYMQAQIDAALARPKSFNCTYCAAYAASQGDLETVAAIGAGTYTQAPSTVTTAPAAAPVAESAPVDTAPTQDTQATTTSESAPTEPAAVTQ